MSNFAPEFGDIMAFFCCFGFVAVVFLGLAAVVLVILAFDLIKASFLWSVGEAALLCVLSYALFVFPIINYKLSVFN